MRRFSRAFQFRRKESICFSECETVQILNVRDGAERFLHEEEEVLRGEKVIRFCLKTGGARVLVVLLPKEYRWFPFWNTPSI